MKREMMEQRRNRTAIEFRSVSKTFSRHLGREYLRQHLTKWFQRRHAVDVFYALRDVSFSVAPGESLAVIGPNGAGKSTLLSLIAGISYPERGEVSVYGKVVALLELGSGFHPDLTGTENVFLNASLLGFSRKRVLEMYDRIVEFSGIGEFIGEPLRTYSSGMIMRLAFSVAVNVDPDILLIDEVLAVGDQDFQAKCIERIHQFKHAGKTLVCVSHATGILESLCDKGLWLDHGRVVLEGRVREVLASYKQALNPARA